MTETEETWFEVWRMEGKYGATVGEQSTLGRRRARLIEADGRRQTLVYGDFQTGEAELADSDRSRDDRLKVLLTWLYRAPGPGGLAANDEGGMR